MRESNLDIFDLIDYVDATCITTNGTINSKGNAIMGKGVAAKAKSLFPYIDSNLADSINRIGNHVSEIYLNPLIIAFPTKTDWRLNSTLELIERSCIELAKLIEKRNWETVTMTRPGCGNGGLRWEQVKPIVEKHLPSIFICNFVR